MSGLDDKAMKRAYRNGWMLLAVVSAFVLLFFWLTVSTNEPPVADEFEMGAAGFVPASSPQGEGYYLPVEGEAQ